MLPRRALDPNLTLEVADPLENLRIQITLWLLPLGALASVAAWVLSVAVGELSPTDRFLLLPLALCFLGLEIYLLRYPYRIRLVWQVALAAIAVYEVATIFYEAAYRLHSRDGISPALVWFPMVYLMAFVLLGRRQAFAFSLIYLGVGLAAGLLGLLFSPPLSATAVNAALQFGFSNAVYVMLLYIFAHLRRHYAQMHQMAHTDPLTGLTNRRSMQGRLETELERARRYARPFVAILADLDRFKEVNDRHGHAVGDQVLREAAARLSQHLRSNDQIARWGGEEFLVLAPETDLASGHALGERLHQAIREAPIAGVPVTLSLGVACYRPGDSPAVLLARADEAMYKAKAAGRDQVVLEEQLEDIIIPVHTLPDVPEKG